MERKYKVGDKVYVAAGNRIIPGVVEKLPAPHTDLYYVHVEQTWYADEKGLLPRNEPAPAIDEL